MADVFILLPVMEGEAPLFAWRAAGDWVADTACPRGLGRGESVVAFVPGTAVTLHTTEIAARKPAEARRIALFALEDDLAEPVELLHAALGPAGDTPSRSVQTASLADMQRWTALLASLDLPDADLVAPQTCLSQGSIAWEGPRESLFRTRAAVFALDADVPQDLVQSLVPDAPDAVHGERLARIFGVEPDGEAAGGNAAWLIQLAAWYGDMPAGQKVSLRQGDFSVRRPMQLEGISRWRPAAALAAASALLWLGSVWLETRALDSQASALRAQTRELVAAIAPEAGGDLQAALGMLRQNQKIAATAMRPTLATAALFEAIEPVADAEVRSLRYDASTGRLTAMVVFGGYGDADGIGDRLEQKGLAVRLGEARQSGSRVMGEFTIEVAS